jgi:hypothetical protein
MFIIKKIISWFKQPTELEAYITSKRPTNAAEVDYWATRYSQERKSSFVWGQ